MYGRFNSFHYSKTISASSRSDGSIDRWSSTAFVNVGRWIFTGAANLRIYICVHKSQVYLFTSPRRCPRGVISPGRHCRSLDCVLSFTCDLSIPISPSIARQRPVDASVYLKWSCNHSAFFSSYNTSEFYSITMQYVWISFVDSVILLDRMGSRDAVIWSYNTMQ